MHERRENQTVFVRFVSLGGEGEKIFLLKPFSSELYEKETEPLRIWKEMESCFGFAEETNLFCKNKYINCFTSLFLL